MINILINTFNGVHFAAQHLFRNESRHDDWYLYWINGAVGDIGSSTAHNQRRRSSLYLYIQSKTPVCTQNKKRKWLHKQ
jgi:hypothetical protein